MQTGASDWMGLTKQSLQLRMDRDPFSVAMHAMHEAKDLTVQSYRSPNVTVTRFRPESCRLRAGEPPGWTDSRS